MPKSNKITVLIVTWNTSYTISQGSNLVDIGFLGNSILCVSNFIEMGFACLSRHMYFWNGSFLSPYPSSQNLGGIHCLELWAPLMEVCLARGMCSELHKNGTPHPAFLTLVISRTSQNRLFFIINLLKKLDGSILLLNATNLRRNYGYIIGSVYIKLFVKHFIAFLRRGYAWCCR